MPAAGQHTIFTDIGGQEVGTDLYLVVSVYRLGKIVNQQVIMDIAIVICYNNNLTLKSWAANIGTAQGGAPGTSAMGPRDWSQQKICNFTNNLVYYVVETSSTL